MNINIAWRCISCLFLSSCSLEEKANFFDYAASAPINEKALAEFDTISRMNGNSSGINQHARVLRDIEYKAAMVLAEKINAMPHQIVFTSSATMSNNIAILGVAKNYPHCHMITSKIEHKSILCIFKYLESIGHEVTYLDVDRYGSIDLKQLSNSIRDNTKLISIQTFNSEIGAIQDLKAIGEIAKKYGVLLHSDASQSFCKYNLDVQEINVDFLTVSGYKIGAPKGIAAVYVRDEKKLQPIIFGTGAKLFPGSRPSALIASFAAAIQNFHFNRVKVTRNFNILVSELLKICNVHINSTVPSHVVSISIGGVLLRDLLKRIQNYSFSSGCSCQDQNQSNVILAIDPDHKLPTCTIRISFSDHEKPEDLVAFARYLKNVVDDLRREKSVGIGCSSDDPSFSVPIKKIRDLLRLTSD
ncbi:MAG: aminotransferase class V-fold PLP-dependent enzyme [Holosporaceae bacterium]|jgi:cysteine desulfurase|nr:aminotransferase class V-fold PLP-dependent enzyme [Holosporaceae bacterium]